MKPSEENLKTDMKTEDRDIKTKPSEDFHKAGEHGAVVFVTQGKDICAECKKPVEG